MRTPIAVLRSWLLLLLAITALRLPPTVIGAVDSVWLEGWTPAPSPTNAWRGLAISADGQTLAAVGSMSLSLDSATWDFLVSTNAGRTWRQAWKGPITNAVHMDRVVMDKDGTIIVASGSGRGTLDDAWPPSLWVSLDRGLSWSEHPGPARDPDLPVPPWALALSHPGDRLYAVNPRGLFLSLDFGRTWTRLENPIPEADAEGYPRPSVATSADGMMVVVRSVNGCWISTNGGEHWSQVHWNGLESGQTSELHDVAVSGDGKTVVVSQYQYLGWNSTWVQLLISRDSGASWSLHEPGLTTARRAALSFDGEKILLGTGLGGGCGPGGCDCPGPAAWSGDGGRSWQVIEAVKAAHVAMSSDGSILAAASNGACWLSPVQLHGIAFQPVILATHATGDLNLSGNRGVFFTVEAQGGPLTYRWLKDGVALEDRPGLTGSQTARLVLSPASDGDRGRYSVVVSNSVGVATAAVGTLDPVMEEPSILHWQQEGSSVLVDGATVTFRVIAAGGALRFQWRKEGRDLAEDAFHTGTQTPELRVSNAAGKDLGEYSVRVSNWLGTAEKVVGRLQLTVPRVLRERREAGTIVLAGDSLRLVVQAEGGLLQPEWRHNGKPLPNAGTVPAPGIYHLELQGVDTADVGKYSLRLSNPLGIGESTEFPVWIGSWESCSVPADTWTSIGVTSDGRRLVAASDKQVLASLDGGTTWQSVQPKGTGWTSVSVASLADAVVVGQGNRTSSLQISRDFGKHWEAREDPPSQFSVRNWDSKSVAMSADASRILVCQSGGLSWSGPWSFAEVPTARLRLSTNGGSTWSTVAEPENRDQYWRSATVSSDGHTMAAVLVYHQIAVNARASWLYWSRNGGVHWQRDTLPAPEIASVVVSGDGRTLLTSAAGRLFRRTPDDSKWTPIAAPLLMSVRPCVSHNGDRIFAVQPEGDGMQGRIIQSDDAGRTWLWSGSPTASWSALACSADGDVVFGAASGRIYRSPILPRATKEALGMIAHPEPGQVRLEWTGVAHRTYELLWVGDLGLERWRRAGAAIADANGRVSMTVAATHERAFWRAVLVE